eukprot:jgi/Picsp_1/5648/NSC_03007-R1_protein
MKKGNIKGQMASSIEEAKELLEELYAFPRQKANNLAILISFLKNSKSTTKSPIIKGMVMFFVDCYERNELEAAEQQEQQGSDAKLQYAKWLIRQKNAFVETLLELMCESGAADQVSALSCLLEFVRGQKLGEFDHELFRDVVKIILLDSRVEPEAFAALIEKYCSFADVHYSTCKAISWTCKEQRSKQGKVTVVNDRDEPERSTEDSGEYNNLVRGSYDVLVNISKKLADFQASGEDLPSWCGASEVGILAQTNDGTTRRQRKRSREANKDTKASGKQVSGKWSSHLLRQRALSDAWLELLKMRIPYDLYRNLLSRVHDIIIPALINPLLLSDFLTHALNREGLDGMLALNGIFILVTEHGLEYPKFYERLYALLTPEIFLSKHRVRFFKLADIFLASPMVPAYSAAAFAKKFARLGMKGSPATAMIAIAFIHNIIRRHPSCMQILHRPVSKVQEQSAVDVKKKAESLPVWRGEDVYDMDEPDPANSRALESSLWELSVFRNHADPTVAKYCLILDKDMTDRRKSTEVNVEEVLSASYSFMFDKEIKRRLKTIPTAVYATESVPKHLFEPAEFATSFPGFTL